MSPEQCKGKPIDRRSDIFALGICLYELTTLRRAFKGNDDFETMKRIVAGDVILPSVAVPGYPRELEAIVLTAMANDPNARFQTAAEMIEALDAFAQRAKLVGSNTALGRFMTQLFGSKKEPWVEGIDAPERTAVSEPAIEIDDASDNEKTIVVEDRRAPTVPEPAIADAAAWQQAEARRPFEQRTPPGGITKPMTTLAGTGMPLSSPGLRLATEPVSQVGARPLVDENLGWQTGVNPMMHAPPGSGARLSTSVAGGAEYRIRSNRGWIVLAILVLAGLATGIALAYSGYL
jgi:serine/threonine-protein kinase